MRPPYDDDEHDETRIVAEVPAGEVGADGRDVPPVPPGAAVNWTPAVPPGPPAPAGLPVRTVGEAAAGRGWRKPEPDVDDASTPAEGTPAVKAPERPAGEPTSRGWTEAEVLRFGATAGAVVCSIALMVSVGLTLPSLPWLPYLIGTLFYGVLAARTWQAHAAAEDAARIRAENASRSRFRMSAEPVDRDGKWT
jgi:hypothetical protein